MVLEPHRERLTQRVWTGLSLGQERLQRWGCRGRSYRDETSERAGLMAQLVPRALGQDRGFGQKGGVGWAIHLILLSSVDMVAREDCHPLGPGAGGWAQRCTSEPLNTNTE